MGIDDFYYGTVAQPPDLEDEGVLSRLARSGVLSPLIWLGETLDKPGRAVRGLLAGKPSELLNLVPLSDTIGLTNPAESVSGRDLLRHYGMAGQEDTWGNWAGGLGAEILLDPLNALTFGTKSSLTAAGQAARKAGTLEGTMAGRIASGNAGLMGLRTPWWAETFGVPAGRLPLGTGDFGVGVANKLGQAGEYLMRDAPVVSDVLSKLQSWFRYGSGYTGDKRIRFAGAVPQAEKEVLDLMAPHGMQLNSVSQDALEQLGKMGVPLEEAQQAWGRAVTGAVEGGFPESPYLRSLGDAASREMAASTVTGLAPAAADAITQLQDVGRQYRRTLGQKVGDIATENPWGLDYFHRQIIGGSLRTGSESAARTIPTEVLAGGSRQLDDLIRDPSITGIAYDTTGKSRKELQAIQETINSKAESIAANAKAHRDAAMGADDFLTINLAQLSDKNIEAKAKDLATWMAQQNPERATMGFYKNDPIASAMEYATNTARQAGPAAGVLNTLAKEAVPLAKRAPDTRYVTLNSALTELGQDAAEYLPTAYGSTRMYDYGGKDSLLKQLVEEGKSTVESSARKDVVKELKQHVIPQDTLDLLKKELAGPGYQQKFGFGELAENITSGFRTGVTVPFPAYHLRNIWEGLVQQGLGGGLSASALSDMYAYMRGGLKDPAKIKEVGDAVNEMFNYGSAFRNQAWHQLGETMVNKGNDLITPWVTQTGKGVTEGVTDYISHFSPKSIAERGEKLFTLNPKESAIVQGGIDVHNKIDNLIRSSQYLALKRQGYAPQAARDIVMQSQLDYSKLTPAEQKLRQLIPFYSFSKQNIVRTAEQMQDPGALASMLRTVTDAGSEGFIPNYVSGSGAAIPIPGGEDGKQRYLSGFSLPFEDEMIGALTSLASGHPVEAGRRFFSTVDPVSKLLATAATGRQLYTGRSLEEITPSAVTSLGGLLSPYTANALSEAVSATPFGRLLSTANAAVGGKDKDILLKLMTGIKTTDVDQGVAAQIAARDAIGHMLLNTGMVGTSENYYPKAEYRDPLNQPDRLQMLLSMMRTMEAQARTAQQQRLNNQLLP